jgi:hypothetical protein
MSQTFDDLSQTIDNYLKTNRVFKKEFQQLINKLNNELIDGSVVIFVHQIDIDFMISYQENGI